MEIKKYTVVPCPNCDNIKIVKETPETTTCGQCRKSFKFKSARKFYTTDSIEKARFVRGKVQARVRDMEDDFDNIIEDVLEYDPSEKSLAQKHIETILDIPEPTSNTTSTQSDTEIAKSALSKRNTISGFIQYCTERGVSEDKSKRLFEQLKREGEFYMVDADTFRKFQ